VSALGGEKFVIRRRYGRPASLSQLPDMALSGEEAAEISKSRRRLKMDDRCAFSRTAAAIEADSIERSLAVEMRQPALHLTV